MDRRVLVGAALTAMYFFHVPARARNCDVPDDRGEFAGPDELPIDAAPWIEIITFDIIHWQGVSGCVLKQGAVEIPVMQEVMPPQEPPSIGPGACEMTPSRFYPAFVRFTPMEEPEPGSYHISCPEPRELPAHEFTFGTKRSVDPPALQVTSATKKRTRYCGDGEDVLELGLDLEGDTSAFFTTGGMLLLEYESGNIDYVGAPRDSSKVEVSLPAGDESEIVVTAISASGVRGPPVVVDVAGIGADQRTSCRVGSTGDPIWLLFSLLAIVCGRCRRVPAATPSPEDPAV